MGFLRESLTVNCEVIFAVIIPWLFYKISVSFSNYQIFFQIFFSVIFRLIFDFIKSESLRFAELNLNYNTKVRTFIYISKYFFR